MKKNNLMFLNYNDKNFKFLFKDILSKRGKVTQNISDDVRDIILQIRNKGDKALLSMIKKYDHLDIQSINEIKIGYKSLKSAYNDLPIKQKEALKFSFKRIKSFHEKQIPIPYSYKDDLGVKLGLKFNSIASVGFYVPGGKALYPSSVLMNLIPAVVAGVENKILVSPISLIDPPKIILASAYLSEVTDFFSMGGAHSIAALAYGTKSIQNVDKIVGPGNSYVAEAKRQVFGNVGIDSIAGPSEILIVSDNQSNPEWIAFDLLSQAEHDEEAQSILITDDKDFAKKVEHYVKSILNTLPRKEIASTSWYNNGAIIIIDNISNSYKLINEISPEHLQLSVNQPNKYLNKIKNAGAIFLGRYTPEAIGDYVAGPNHVLPTGGSARFSSGLGVYDFIKRSSYVECNKENLLILSKHASILADAEGLDAHKISMKIRN